MDEKNENIKTAGSYDFKALPNDVAQVSVEDYLKDGGNNFKVIDVRTPEEYREDRWEAQLDH